MKSIINLAIALFFCTQTLCAQSLSHAEEFLNLQNKAVAAAKENSFDETYKFYNELLEYATSHREVAYLIDTKLCGYVIVNKLEYAEKQLDVEIDVCDLHKLIYDSYQSNEDLTVQEKVRGIVILHKTFGEISVQINQLEKAGNYFESAFYEYDCYVAQHKKEDPYLLNLLAYIDEEYYELFVEAFDFRTRAFMNMSSDDPNLDDTFLMCYYIYTEAQEDLLGDIKFRKSLSQNHISENVKNIFNHRNPVAIGESMIKTWRNLINYTIERYGKSYIESFELESHYTGEGISQFVIAGDEFFRGVLYLIYDSDFDTYINELCENNPDLASVVLPELISMMSEVGKTIYADKIIEDIINNSSYSLRFRESIQNRAARLYSDRRLYDKVIQVLTNYSDSIFHGNEVEYDNVDILYENLSSLANAYNHIQQPENYRIVSEYYNNIKSSKFHLLNEFYKQEVLMDKYFDLIEQEDSTQALVVLNQMIEVNENLASKSMWQDKLHLSNDWSPEIHSMLALHHYNQFAQADDIFKKILENYEFWGDYNTAVYRHYCVFLYNHNKEAELCQHLRRVYQLMLNEYLVSSFSMNKADRSTYWFGYQYLSEMLEAASFMMLNNLSLTELVYDIALAQKGFLVKYERMISENVINSGDQELITAYNKYKDAEVACLPDTEELEKAFMRLYSTYPEFREVRFTNWKEVQKSLTAHDIAIEFTMCGAKSYAALLLRNNWDEPKLIELCSIDELEDIYHKGQVVYNNSNQLYSHIWEQLEPYMKKGDNVYFAPHGLLHQMNIEVVRDAKGRPVNKKYSMHRVSSTANVINRGPERGVYEVATLYGGLNYNTDTTSLITLNRAYTRTITNKSQLLNDDEQTRSGWSYLPGTAKEVKNIENILGNGQIRTVSYTDIEGTEESFKALSGNSTPIIHIATHGFYLEDKNARKEGMFELAYTDDVQTISPLKRSGLMFSGGQHAWLGKEIPAGIEDGVLTAEEIAGMNLTGTDLLVLSACQTGLGEINNEGVAGLQRGFKIAGVNTIIMSLWEVSDAATEVLMTNFYTMLIKGKSKREAFNAAVEAVKKEYESPEYWAAFIMLD